MAGWLTILGGVAVLGAVLFAAFWAVVSWSVETPRYEVRARGPAGLEIRAYPAMAAAEVTRSGARWEAVRAGFGPLARYIFARDRDGPRIAMTAPVTQSPAPDAAGGWRIRFLMPASHDLDSLPAPSAAEGVRLAPIPARRMAAARFGGVATDARLREATARLEAWLAAQGETAAAAPVYAYYNDPMTPGFLRRNEVLIALTDGPR